MYVRGLWGVSRGGGRMKRDTSAYVVDGVRWPSVTEVLELTGWSCFDGVDPERLAQASDRGLWVHAATQLVDENQFDWDQIPIDRQGAEQRQWLDYVRAYRRFCEEHRLSISHREYRIRHDVHRFVGTLDLAGALDDSPVIIDIKTSYGIPASAALQTAAYHIALDDGPRRRLVLHLRADGTYRLREFSDPADRGLFLAALATMWAQITRGVMRLDKETGQWTRRPRRLVRAEPLLVRPACT